MLGPRSDSDYLTVHLEALPRRPEHALEQSDTVPRFMRAIEAKNFVSQTSQVTQSALVRAPCLSITNKSSLAIAGRYFRLRIVLHP